MTINIIVAVGKKNEIGCNNNLLANIPEDMKYFRETTKNSIVIMGRKTLESLPNGNPLKGRINIVITKQKISKDNVIVVDSIEKSIEVAKKLSESEGREVFVIGGGSIYEQFMDKADKLYITHLFEEFEADTYFPEISEEVWELEEVKADVENIKCNIPHIFAIYKRK